jgi:hypothetical protein
MALLDAASTLSPEFTIAALGFSPRDVHIQSNQLGVSAQQFVKTRNQDLELLGTPGSLLPGIVRAAETGVLVLLMPKYAGKVVSNLRADVFRAAQRLNANPFSPEAFDFVLEIIRN